MVTRSIPKNLVNTAPHVIVSWHKRVWTSMQQLRNHDKMKSQNCSDSADHSTDWSRCCILRRTFLRLRICSAHASCREVADFRISETPVVVERWDESLNPSAPHATSYSNILICWMKYLVAPSLPHDQVNCDLLQSCNEDSSMIYGEGSLTHGNLLWKATKI